jgi:glutamate carboxypeptidase
MEELIRFIDGKEQEMLRFLERLVNIDSGTLHKPGIDQIGAILAERLSSFGFAMKQVPQSQYGNHLVGNKPGKGKKRILFIGHMDTVFPPGTADLRPFRIDGSRAYGPGVLDMKGGIVCLLYALEALRSTGHASYDEMAMGVVLNSDEELLSPTSREIIENQARQSHTVCVFEPARPGGEYVTHRKGAGKYRITVRGRAAHSGTQPEKGRSAIIELAHKIIGLHGLTDFSIGTTVNVGLIQGGERFNIVAEKAFAEFDLRVPDVEEAKRMEDRIREIALTPAVPDTTAELMGGLVFPPMEQTPQAKLLFEAIQGAGRALGLDLRGISTGGGSDGNYAAQFAPTLDGMGPQGSEPHSDREFIEVATLAERSKVTAFFLASWPGVIAALDKGPSIFLTGESIDM